MKRVWVSATVTLILVALGVAAATSASFAAPSSASFGNQTPPPTAPPDVPIEIHIKPPIEGVQLTIDGVPFLSDGEGIARTLANPRRRHTLKLLNTEASAPDTRATFSRWCCNLPDTRSQEIVFHPASRTKFEIAYDVSQLVTLKFTDAYGRRVPPDIVDSITLRSSLGARLFLRNLDAVWVPSSRQRGKQGHLTTDEIRYKVENVAVEGANVVNEGQQRFSPSRMRTWPIRVQFHTALFRAQDALFGSPAGHLLRIRYSGGKVKTLRLNRNGEAELSLPRGEYAIQVEGSGISFERPLVLTRSQQVDLKMFSILDLALVAFLILGLALGLPLAGYLLRRGARNRIALEQLSQGGALVDGLPMGAMAANRLSPRRCRRQRSTRTHQ